MLKTLISQDYPRACLTYTELALLLGGTQHSIYSKVKRLLADGKLISLRRGLYCLTPAFGYFDQPHPFELAQYIYAPSYISLESALAFYKLIPEAVYVTTSVCIKRAKEFQTPLGTFSYLTLPRENFYTEVILHKENNYQFFIAKPWKAITDYIYCYKKDWVNTEPLLKSLRITIEDLPILTDNEKQSLDDYYQSKRVTHFLEKI